MAPTLSGNATWDGSVYTLTNGSNQTGTLSYNVAVPANSVWRTQVQVPVAGAGAYTWTAGPVTVTLTHGASGGTLVLKEGSTEIGETYTIADFAGTWHTVTLKTRGYGSNPIEVKWDNMSACKGTFSASFTASSRHSLTATTTSTATTQQARNIGLQPIMCVSQNMECGQALVVLGDAVMGNNLNISGYARSAWDFYAGSRGRLGASWYGFLALNNTSSFYQSGLPNYGLGVRDTGIVHVHGYSGLEIGVGGLGNAPVCVSSTGLVGINTTAPSYTLDVNGNLRCNYITSPSLVDTTNANNITMGTLAAARLQTSGVLPGSYGSGSSVPALIVDSYGRVTGVTNTAINITSGAVSGLANSATVDATDAANIGKGTLSVARLPTSGVAGGVYGSGSSVPAVTVDSYGRITGVTNTAIAIASTAVSGLANSATIDATDAANIGKGTLNVARLPTSGVAGGSYGSGSSVPAVTVDSYGRITGVTNTAIAIASTAVSGLANSATVDATDAANIGKGTLNVARLPTSGVAGGMYGSGSSIPAVTVDSYGRITGVTNTAIAIASGAVSGLSSSATIDATNANNITSGTLPSARLPTTGVTAATYGNASLHAVISVDAYGRVTAATNTSIAIASGAVSGMSNSATIDATNANNITLGTLPAARLPTSGVTGGTYGSGSSVPAVTVDSYGRITGVFNSAIAIASGAVSGLSNSATIDATNANNITLGILPAARLPSSGVVSGSYGSRSSVPAVTVDSYGRITGVSNSAIAIASGAVSGLSNSATIDATNANNITLGTLPAARLPSSGVVSGSYGSGSSVPAVTVDSYGRITGVSNSAIAIASGAVSGLSNSATIDATNANNITLGTLPAARLPSSGVVSGSYGSGSSVPAVTVDSYGMITGVTNTAIAIASSAVTGLANSATIDATNASNITKGVLAIAQGGTGINSLTTGKVLVGNGTGALIQDSNFHWDNTNDRLGLGTATPTQTLDVNGSANVSGAITLGTGVQLHSGGYLFLSQNNNFYNSGNGNVPYYGIGMETGGIMHVHSYYGVRFGVSSSNSMFLAPGGKLGILTMAPNYPLDVTGDVNCTGVYRVNGTPLALSATTDATNANNITTGTLPATRLPTSGVVGAVYGSASTVPAINVDTYGRVTGVTNTAIAIASTAVSGLALSATTDATNANNITTGTLPATRLPTSGVVGAVYGSASTVPAINVDTYGRVTGVTNTAIAIASTAVSGLALSATTDATNANNITTGTLPATRLPTSGVVGAVYGSASTVPAINVDTYGRVTGVTNTAIAIASTAVSGLALSATTDATNANNITTGTLPATRLPTSGVVGAVYGSASTVPAINVDTYGRVTGVTNTAIAIASTAVSGLALSATTDATNANNITTGTLPAARLPTSGVVGAIYGSASTVPAINVDTYGRVTSVTNTAIAIASTAVSGLALSATTDATNANNITTGTLPAARLPTSGVTAKLYGNASILPVVNVDTYGRVISISNTNIAISATAVTSGTLPVGRGGTGSTGLAANKLVVGVGTGVLQAPTELHWDGSQMGIKTAAPGHTLEVASGLKASYITVESPEVIAANSVSVSSGPVHLVEDGTHPRTNIMTLAVGNVSALNASGANIVVTTTDDMNWMGVQFQLYDLNTSTWVDIGATGSVKSGSLAYLQALVGSVTFNPVVNPTALALKVNGAQWSSVDSNPGMTPGSLNFSNYSPRTVYLSANTDSSDVSVAGNVNCSANINCSGTLNTNQTSASNTAVLRAQTGWMFQKSSNSSNVVSVANTGDITSVGDVVAFGTISDARLKEQVITVDRQHALVSLRHLRPVDFTWKRDLFNQQHAGQTDTGFIAQEVEQVYPVAVGSFRHDDMSYKNIRIERIVSLLVAAVQALDAKISIGS